jgi:polyisoprenyl-phosphate glycosyltransferase
VSADAGTLWIVTPVYFDVEAFELLRGRIRETLGKDGDAGGPPVRFVVLDDSAGLDPSMARVEGLGDVVVLRPPFSLGHQRGLVYALREVASQLEDADVVVTMDSDGEDRPEDVPRLLALLRSEGPESRRVVLALRARRHDSRSFRLFYFLFRLLFRALTGVVVRTGNFAAYRGWVARRWLLHPYFDLCYSATFLALPLPVTYLPCERGRRFAGESRMSYARLFLHGLTMLMPFTDRIAIRALWSFSVTMVAAGALSVAVVAVRLFTERAVPGWATYTLLMLVILSFVALGNFIVLFTLYSQSRAISFANLEDKADARA